VDIFNRVICTTDACKKEDPAKWPSSVWKKPSILLPAKKSFPYGVSGKSEGIGASVIGLVVKIFITK
jgi:hypothetical protein